MNVLEGYESDIKQAIVILNIKLILTKCYENDTKSTAKILL
jgi:hypothetical protein